MEYMAEFEAAYNNGYKKGLKDAMKHEKYVLPNNPSWVECDVCGKGYYNLIGNKYNFCPICGAKMDGE